MGILGGVLDGGSGAFLSSRANLTNVPHGETRPLYHADGSPLIHGQVWVDISDPNNPVVREFYAPASYDDSYDNSFQN